MKQFMPLMLALLAMSAMSIPANAQFAQFGTNSSFGFNNNSGINGEQARLQMRINQGIRNGSLTQREAAQLQARLNQIAALEARMRIQGLSRYERQMLNTRLTRLSYEISQQMNDFQRRHIGSRGNGRFWR